MKGVSGTLDFKWPSNQMNGSTKLRVAFQQLSSRDRALLNGIDPSELITKFEACAKLWSVDGISLDVMSSWALPAPAVAAPEKGGEPLFMARSDLVDTRETVTYDLLISFASMPMKFQPPGNANSTTLEGQAAVLGSYASRTDYGTPTMLLGPNRNRLGGASFADYFNSREFTHICLHEIGHALGLIHEHQNPRYTRGKNLLSGVSRKDVEQRLDRVGVQFATQFNLAEIDRELGSSWTETQYCQFRDWEVGSDPLKVVSGGKEEHLEDCTVMAHPGWSSLFSGVPTMINTLSQPTPSDLRYLADLYPL